MTAPSGLSAPTTQSRPPKCHGKHRHRQTQRNMQLDPAGELPPELFHEILGYLDANDLARATRVSCLWYRLCSDGTLWQALCRQRWQGKRDMRRGDRFGMAPRPNGQCADSGKLLWPAEKWKWAYGEVESEALRTATTESEIVESYWKFTVCPCINSTSTDHSTRMACRLTIILFLSQITVLSSQIYFPNHYRGSFLTGDILR